MANEKTGELGIAILSTRKHGSDFIRRKLKRTTFDPVAMAEVEAKVKEIIAAVRERGDDALVEIERQFGWKGCSVERLKVNKEEMDAAYLSVPTKILEALCLARNRLERFHQQQLPHSWFVQDDGSILGEVFHPIERVGIYVPGGLAAYPSTVLHVAVPAKVAGVKELYVVTPPDKNGKIHPLVLVAAHLVGVDAVFRVGGAHSIAALAFGTQTIPKVDKIAGPSGIYPVVAKRLLYGVVGIDLLPGPSEVAVVADETAPPDWVALELLAQAEHGPDSVAVLFTPSEKLLKETAKNLARFLCTSRRRKYLEPALKNHGALVLTRDMDEAIALVNELAYEHVALMVAEPMRFVGKLRYAGAIFLGSQTTVAFGDYLAGPSHVLPTAGTARFSSGLSVVDFMVRSSLVGLSEEKARLLANAAAMLADSEGLTAHAKALRVRRKKLGKLS
ncbi:MAG: histidinol dehydrogenase [Armatimonadetes bacterium]|nr:histidinol dehydrogenase [Armatimonadota bacterium]MCX7968625.1 histidinol dehydrogenase [Armatimonadota bacterium]MDW8142294.1 histidinol dehydrogenase [Armatimonadota bacterium]